MDQIDWGSRMARLSDEDLIAIVSSGEADGYHPAAIDAATGELRGRALPEGVVAKIENHLEVERGIEAGRSSAPLSNGAWVAFVIFGIVLIPTVGAAIALYMRGYHQKTTDALKAILVSYLFWGIIAALLNVLFFLS